MCLLSKLMPLSFQSHNLILQMSYKPFVLSAKERFQWFKSRCDTERLKGLAENHALLFGWMIVVSFRLCIFSRKTLYKNKG